MVDKDTQEICRDGDEILSSMEDLVDKLPDNTPRYIVLSYPMVTHDGRAKLPLIMVYWIPPTCDLRSKMLYAGATEQFREQAQVSRYVDYNYLFQSLFTTNALTT